MGKWGKACKKKCTHSSLSSNIFSLNSNEFICSNNITFSAVSLLILDCIPTMRSLVKSVGHSVDAQLVGRIAPQLCALCHRRERRRSAWTHHTQLLSPAPMDNDEASCDTEWRVTRASAASISNARLFRDCRRPARWGAAGVDDVKWSCAGASLTYVINSPTE